MTTAVKLPSSSSGPTVVTGVLISSRATAARAFARTAWRERRGRRRGFPSSVSSARCSRCSTSASLMIPTTRLAESSTGTALIS